MGAGLQDHGLEQRVLDLRNLVKRLKAELSTHDRLEVLNALPQVQEACAKPGLLRTFLAGLTPDCEYALKAVLAIGQGGIVFRCPDQNDQCFERLRTLLQQLIVIEKFYGSIGGIIGYQLEVLQLILEQAQQAKSSDRQERFLRPIGLDISQDTLEVRQARWVGLARMGEMGEIYPVGGAGDRLNLIDDDGKTPLPAARLRFAGRTLLESLVRDLQAREYLHYKLFNEQLVTPVAFMTSEEKDNHQQIVSILREASFFGRPSSAFFSFSQPMVPVITIHGDWCMQDVLQVHMKPGGHGVMWMLARESGALDWFANQDRDKVLVRQINNPIADTDGGTLPFTGVGLEESKAFGFASCKRLLNTAEGVNVIRERSIGDEVYCGVTNIEYCEFPKHGIEEAAVEPGSLYSEYPANTNILFADLNAVSEALEICPIPGMLINMKSEFRCIGPDGREQFCPAGRLESTMQNLADALADRIEETVAQPEDLCLRTYLTSNLRHKTISVTKKSYELGRPIEETPEGCFATLQKNYHTLLGDYCQMTVPFVGDKQSYVRGELPFIVHLHPALGPLWEVIAQKIHGGSMARGAELQLQIAELSMQNVHLRGSLVIDAGSPLGTRDGEGHTVYDEDGGKCRLKNVRIENEGMDQEKQKDVWRNDIVRKQALTIVLHGNAEFEAEDITITGNQSFEVPAGHRMRLLASAQGFEQKLEAIDQPTWYWSYQVDDEYRIML
ncbi:MAG: hypothetical protein KDK78_05955, partial [Chlamydiia bacterium]|nr:hypothetical protein [Chlamydiia bacterium]